MNGWNCWEAKQALVLENVKVWRGKMLSMGNAELSQTFWSLSFSLFCMDILKKETKRNLMLNGVPQTLLLWVEVAPPAAVGTTFIVI